MELFAITFRMPWQQSISLAFALLAISAKIPRILKKARFLDPHGDSRLVRTRVV